MKLVRGGADGFGSWLMEEGIGESHSKALCQQLEVFSAKTLCEPQRPTLPSGFVAAIEKAKEVSNALLTQ